MSKHTPGPWAWRAAEFTECELVSANGVVILTATGADGDENDDDLIAAAPDLLEALQRLIAAHDAHSTLHAEDGDDVARMIEWAAAEDAARSAIAKAEGKS